MLIALSGSVSGAVAATHLLDLRPVNDGSGTFQDGYFKVPKGGSFNLRMTDSTAHGWAIFGLYSLNPQYAGWVPTNTDYFTVPVVCTTLGDHLIQGTCLSTLQSVYLNVRVTHIELVPDPMYGDILEVPQNTVCRFTVWDYLGHTCCIFGFDQLNTVDPFYDTWVPTGVGGAYGDPLCTELGDHPIYGYCVATGEYDQTLVRVLAVDLKPDDGPSGFVQVNKNGTVAFTLRVQGGHSCAIYNLGTLNPSYSTVTGTGVRSFTATCVTKGDHTIQGKDLVTQQSDYTVVRVSEITLTQWESILSPLDTNPNAGGGKRIYPDWLLTDFPNGPSPSRAWVQVHSTIDPPPCDPNRPFSVQFAQYDVDDPSANQAPVDNETMGPENRGQCGWAMAGQGGGNYSEVPVTVTGHAASVFSVSPQPGDNFRVNAQILGEGTYAITVPQGVTDGHINRTDTGQPPRTEEVTPMLTVWRRFHVERDSMVAMVEAEDYLKGYVRSVSPSGSGWQVTVEWSAGDTVEVSDHFVPGIMRDDVAGTMYNVAWNQGMTSGQFIAKVTGPSAPTVGRAVTFYDDDFDLSTNPPTRRPNLLPELPDISLAQTLFRAAYVETDDAGGVWNQSNKTFYPYITAPLGAWRNARLKGRTLYWIGYVLASFQYSENRSWDPDTGIAYLGSTSLPESGASVYYETDRDMGYYSERSRDSAHELGHHLCRGVWHAAFDSSVTGVDPNQPRRRFQVAGIIRSEDGLLIGNGSLVVVTTSPDSEMSALLSSYTNGSGVCWLQLQNDLPVAPQIGQACLVCSKSLMAPRHSASVGTLCPAEISLIRTLSQSPLN
jgi:hypothetical protein